MNPEWTQPLHIAFFLECQLRNFANEAPDTAAALLAEDLSLGVRVWDLQWRIALLDRANFIVRDVGQIRDIAGRSLGDHTITDRNCDSKHRFLLRGYW